MWLKINHNHLITYGKKKKVTFVSSVNKTVPERKENHRCSMK